ncbi:MAG: hypothetical protein HY320_04830 [Armatimonadetes bacterium]|nr:hypothetical protein [Armatimonadota bacterium]
MLRHNLGLKLLSLGFALLLFYYVHGQEFEAPRQFMAQVDIPVPPGQALVTPSSSHQLVTISVRGPTWLLNDLQDTDWQAELDLSGFQPGQQQALPVRVIVPEKLRGRGAQIEAHPSQIIVHMEPRVTKALPVTLDADNALPSEWEWREPPRATPAQVSVQGLRPQVERVARVVAALRDISPQESLSLPVTLHALDRHGQDMAGEVQLEPPFARVKGRLVRQVWSKRVYVQVVFAGIPPGWRPQVSAEPSTVAVYGSLEALRDLQFLETPVVELPEGQTKVTEEVTLSPPPGITRLQPRTVKVVVQAIPRAPLAGGSTPPARP